ncbi:Vacuolar membrane protease [Venturia nashicola]|uniref:Vacuolar membrane protease n=1 Tax=Venturia nashicola TaxID=86259 RepID=A0A4Z1PNH5_9PEZI|nr:Vacuolar membrane protease [Venturia nashicola]
MAQPTQGDDAARTLRQPPITRLNSPTLDPNLSILPTPPPNHTEPVRDWSALSYPYTIPFPSPSQTGYALQPSAAEQIRRIDDKWSSLQHHELLDTLRERGEETHLGPVVVQTLTQFGHEIRRRKERMAYHNSLPIQQQIPLASMMPNNVSRELYVAHLQQKYQNARFDEQVYRVMEGLPPLPPHDDELPPLSEARQLQLLTEGVQLLPEGLSYQQTDTASAAIQQGPDQSSAPPSPGLHDSSPSVPAEPYVRNFNKNTDSHVSGSENPLTTLTTPLQLAPTLAAQPPPTHPQTFNIVGGQISELVNQEQFDSNASIMPQQTMRMGTGQQGFESGMVVSHEMAIPPLSTAHPPGQIISGSNLLQHDDLRQKQRKEEELRVISQIIARVLNQQPSFDMLKLWFRSNNISPSIRSMVWNHQALAQWRTQKHMEYVAEVQEYGRSVHKSDLTYSALLMVAQQHRRSIEWAADVSRCASEHGWNAELKRSELTHIVQRVAEFAVSKDVSWDGINHFAVQNNYPRYQFMELIAEMGRRGWNVQQKKAEYQQQQRMMRDPSAFTTSNQSVFPVQQSQQQPMQGSNQIPSTFPSQTTSPPQQLQSPFRNQTTFPPQQVQQRQQSMTPAMMNGSSPHRLPASQKHYIQDQMNQQQAQRTGLLPTPSPGLPFGQLESLQTQTQNASNQGQGVPNYPTIMGVPLGDPSEFFLRTPSPYVSRTPGRGSTASPSNSATHAAFIGKVTANGKGNRHAKEPEPWERQSGVLHSPLSSSGDPATPVCSPSKSDSVRHQSGLTSRQQNRMETSMRKQQTGPQARAAEDEARKQGEGQRDGHSGNGPTQVHNTGPAQGTSFDQAQASKTAPTARMVAKRPDEDQVDPEMPDGKRRARGVREWKRG